MEESKYKTRYQWCLEQNIRPLDLHESEETNFMESKIGADDFIVWLGTKTVKPNSTPRKPEKYLELRMYGFVPYNISDIQKGIQFGHAVVEYSLMANDYGQYEQFAKRWKTFIILNGGTSNVGKEVPHGYSTINYMGSLDSIAQHLVGNDIKHATFYEPDLNNMLSAVVFLVDERVFNKELYPDFKSSPYPWLEKNRYAKPTPKQLEDWEAANDKNYQAWEEKIGGPKNAFLRELLKDKRLA